MTQQHYGSESETAPLCGDGRSADDQSPGAQSVETDDQRTQKATKRFPWWGILLIVLLVLGVLGGVAALIIGCAYHQLGKRSAERSRLRARLERQQNLEDSVETPPTKNSTPNSTTSPASKDTLTDGTDLVEKCATILARYQKFNPYEDRESFCKEWGAPKGTLGKGHFRPERAVARGKDGFAPADRNHECCSATSPRE